MEQHPRMVLYFSEFGSFCWVNFENALDEVGCQSRHVTWNLISSIQNEFVKIVRVFVLVRQIACNHYVEDDSH